MSEAALADLSAARRGLPDAGRPSVRCLSVAGALPPGRVSSAELAAGFGVSEDWIVSRTGIRERPRAGAEDRLSDLAAAAGELALARAGVEAAELDLVIVATITADELTPAAAAHVARELGVRRAGAFDIGAACTGFLSGVALAAGQIESGRAGRVLLIGADICSRFIDFEDKRVAPLFADGAGAIVLGAGPPDPEPAPVGDPAAAVAPGIGWLGPVVLGTDGEHAGTLCTDERRLLRMDGPEVFRHAVSRMHEACLEALEAAHIRLEDVDLLVPHQANARITRALQERFRLPADRVVDSIARLGNSSGATLPLALAHARQDGRLRPGAIVLLAAFGAGFSWGACVLQWGGSMADTVPSMPASTLRGPAALRCERV